MSADPATISQRQLRNDSGAVLRAVQAGGSFVITNHGTPVARIVPYDDPLEGVPIVQRATPGRSFSELVPERGTTDRSGLDILLELRGDR